MPIHTVTKHGQTKTGKKVVYFDNKHSYTDMVFLGDTEAPPIGSVIDADTASSNRDGKTFWFLNAWGLRPTVAVPAPTSPAPRTNGPVQTNASPNASYTEPERMFISNIIAAGINAGAIKSVVDLIPWTNAALYALRHAKADLPDTIDPEVGF